MAGITTITISHAVAPLVPHSAQSPPAAASSVANTGNQSLSPGQLAAMSQATASAKTDSLARDDKARSGQQGPPRTEGGFATEEDQDKKQNGIRQSKDRKSQGDQSRLDLIA